MKNELKYATPTKRAFTIFKNTPNFKAQWGSELPVWIHKHEVKTIEQQIQFYVNLGYTVQNIQK